MGEVGFGSPTILASVVNCAASSASCKKQGRQDEKDGALTLHAILNIIQIIDCLSCSGKDVPGGDLV